MSGGDEGFVTVSVCSVENLSPRGARGNTGETSFTAGIFGTLRKALTKCEFSGWFHDAT